MKQFISVNDVPDVASLVQEGLALKYNPFAFDTLGKNKTLGLIFFNPSLRTRLSSQRAALNLGMNVIVMNIGGDGWNLEFEDGTVMNGNSQEHVKDAVQVISEYVDIIGVRTFPGLKDRSEDYNEKVMSYFTKYSSVPVISLESATRHPLQSLADLITIQSYQIKRPKVVATWAPHPRALPQCVMNSFMEWITKTDAEVVLTHPEEYELAEEFTQGATIEYNQKKAFEGADFVYVKNWSSYKNYGQILSQDPAWIVDEEKMALTNHGKLMHCMPVRRNVIATDKVLDDSIMIEQAGNRVYSCQAILKNMLKP